MLLFCLEEEIIDDEEFAVLYEEYTPQNLPFPHCQYDTFSLLNNRALPIDETDDRKINRSIDDNRCLVS